MSNIAKIVGSIVAGILVIAGLAGFHGNGIKSVGNNFNPVIVDFAQGISVKNRLVIDAFGNFIGSINQSTSSSASTTVGTFVEGGGTTSTTTLATTATLLSTDIDLENYLIVTPGGASLTLTLPASSTMSTMLPTTGQTRTIIIRNATTTAGVSLTLAAGTGVALLSASSSFSIVSKSTGDAYGELRLVRRGNSNFAALFTPYQ